MPKKLKDNSEMISDWREELEKEKTKRTFNLLYKQPPVRKRTCIGILSDGPCSRTAERGSYCSICYKRHIRREGIREPRFRADISDEYPQ